MKKFTFLFAAFLIVWGLFADENTDRLFDLAIADIHKLEGVPLKARVDVSDYDVVPRIFSTIMGINDSDAPFLFINDVQLTIGVSNFDMTDITHQEEGGREVVDYTIISYNLDFLGVNPAVHPADTDLYNMFLHQYGLYSTPLFQYVEAEEFQQLCDLADTKQMYTGFSGGILMGVGGVGLSCLITVLIVRDYVGMFIGTGVGCIGAAAFGSWIFNMLNDDINNEMRIIYQRIADRVNAAQ